MRLLLVGLFLALWTPSQADACSRAYTTLFENFDRSAVVAHARVHHENGKIVLDVIRAIKGSPGNRIRLNLPTRGAVSTCTPGLKMRATGIIFLTAEGHFAGAYDSFPKASKELLAAMTVYANATDQAARAAVLVDLIAENKPRIAFDASLALAEDPAALAQVTTKDRDRLRIVEPVDARSYVHVVLARLGVPDKKLAFRDFESITKPDELADKMMKSNMRVAAIAAERCERVHGKRLYGIRYLIDFTEVENDTRDRVMDSFAKACRTGTPVD